MPTSATRYAVLIGINYPPNDTRAEVGDVIELPALIAQDLLEQGAIEPESAKVAREALAAAPAPLPEDPAWDDLTPEEREQFLLDHPDISYDDFRSGRRLTGVTE